MNMETVIRVPLKESIFNTFLYYVNTYGVEEYVMKRSEAIKDFTNFLSKNEQKAIARKEWVRYVIFYVDKCTQ